jgi:hypothetical protein
MSSHRMHRRHKVLLSLAIALAVAAWFAWSALMVGTDLSAGG